MPRTTIKDLEAQLAELKSLLQQSVSQPVVPIDGDGTHGKYVRRGRRGPKDAEGRRSYLAKQIETASRLAKEKDIHYSIFEMPTGKLYIFSELTEHREAQKGHKATEKWGPKLYHTLSGVTPQGNAYIA